MRDEYSLYWVWLSEKLGVASKDFVCLTEQVPDAYDVYRLNEAELDSVEGIGEMTRRRLSDKSLEDAYTIIKYCRKNKIEIIGYSDERYPTRLRTIENPPVMLYCQGKLPDMNSRLCIGMVGTRKMSEYGKQTAYKISYELASANACIVSGMALGIDSVCACGALEARGDTVAVLGCGLSVTYPREHEKLRRIISKHGAVISEYSPFVRPEPHNFPKRNRIISGLCQGVVVVEGARGSGALITAARAISQGRELFAVPGNVGESNSDGPNDLIRTGANVALCAKDILDNFSFLYSDVINYGALNAAKARSSLPDGLLKRYGISSAQYRARFVSRQTPAEPEAAVSAESVQKSENSEANNKKDTAIIASLDAGVRRVYEALPTEGAFSPDAVVGEALGVGEVITALTILEINGLVASLPGGMFKRV